MRSRIAIERMFRAFNRRASEDAVGNFMEFCSEYGSEAVANASNYVIQMESALPTPAEFKKICQTSRTRKDTACEFCGDKGYIGTTREDPFDDDGFKIIGHGYGVKCCCDAEIKDKVKTVPGTKHKHWTIARLLAKKLAKKSGRGFESWISDYWTSEDAPIWCEHAERLDTMVNLIQAEAVIDEMAVEKVSESPFKAAFDAVESALKVNRTKGLFGEII